MYQVEHKPHPDLQADPTPAHLQMVLAALLNTGRALYVNPSESECPVIVVVQPDTLMSLGGVG